MESVCAQPPTETNTDANRVQTKCFTAGWRGVCTQPKDVQAPRVGGAACLTDSQYPTDGSS